MLLIRFMLTLTLIILGASLIIGVIVICVNGYRDWLDDGTTKTEYDGEYSFVKDKQKHRQVILSFNDFISYYRMNPESYDFKPSHPCTGHFHPYRDDYVIQFRSVLDCIRFRKWLKNKCHSEHIPKSEEGFLRLVKEDVDFQLEKAKDEQYESLEFLLKRKE